MFRIVNEETRETVEDPAAKVLRLGVIVGLANHTVLLARDGRELPIDDSGSPIVDDDGGVTGTVLVFRDITERRQSEEALRKAQEDLARMARLTTLGELTRIDRPRGEPAADGHRHQCGSLLALARRRQLRSREARRRPSGSSGTAIVQGTSSRASAL